MKENTEEVNKEFQEASKSVEEQLTNRPSRKELCSEGIEVLPGSLKIAKAAHVITKEMKKDKIDTALRDKPTLKEIKESGISRYHDLSGNLAPIAAKLEKSIASDVVEKSIEENTKDEVYKEINKDYNTNFMKISNSIAPSAAVLEKKLISNLVENNLEDRPTREELVKKNILKSKPIVLPENEKPWVIMQVKSFIRWVNLRLVRRRFEPITDVRVDFQTGHKLAELLSAAINAPMPVFRKTGSRSRDVNRLSIQAKYLNMDRMALVFNILRKEVRNLGVLKEEDIVEGDLKYKLSLIWRIILEYNRRNLSEEDSNLEKAVLLWLNRIVKEYEGLENGVKNLQTDLRNGLAFAAILNHFDNECLNYKSFYNDFKSDLVTNKQRLNEVFSIAEERFGISRLLDPEDLDTENADSKSILTYLGEWLQAFTSKMRKRKAAEIVKNFTKFQMHFEGLYGDYKTNAGDFVTFCSKKIQYFKEIAKIGNSVYETKENLRSLENYFLEEKAKKSSQLVMLTSKYLEIITLAKINERKLPIFTEEILPKSLQKISSELVEAEFNYLSRLNVQLSSYLKKEEDESSTNSENFELEIERSYDTFVCDKNGTFSLLAFNSALQALGLVQNEKAFLKLKNSNSHEISKEDFKKYCLERFALKDDKGGIKDSFAMISTNKEKGGIKKEALLEYLETYEANFLEGKMNGKNEVMDYGEYVDKVFD